MGKERHKNEQEDKFPEGTFGHYIEVYSPAGLFALSTLLKRNGDRDTGQFERSFERHKEYLLALCNRPGVKISTKQGEIIGEFLDKIFDFPMEPDPTRPGNFWVKIDYEKELILATYINSLH